MLNAITLLLLFQLAGEALAVLFGWPIPGPVIGMVLMLVALTLRDGPGDQLRTTANGLLQHLSLLFVPAGTGVLVHMHLVAEAWLPLVAALVASTVMGIVVTALVLKIMLRRNEPGTTP